ncbi:hypothetical protein GCM10007860_32000 [Chitiniphilus shinanonensis]|uniref:OmpA-like domain-containing protein n=1 Tax=Chitiniphilus shinanonensis TaxID=553088 RepID=A0ABQ6BY00_9NEIS|nr:OmpA family protein [Chitiniphilus shinanonensis]GLS06035.1 hypothetical protein GCM10007860_32000 [Chitiniphilus shinanonensis]
MRIVIGLLGLALLAGCADTPKKTEPAKDEGKWRKEAPAPAPAKPTPTPAPSATPAVDPNTFSFDKMSVSLGDADKARAAALADKAKAATSVSIRGFCDRAEVGNAKDAAIARANAVRTELIKAGVPAAKIRIRFTTDQPRHAAVVEFQ